MENNPFNHHSYRVIIAGSRSIEKLDREHVGKLLDQELPNLPKDDTIILSGTARGADQYGEWWAETRGYPVERHPADWGWYGKSAGYRRNREMAQVANHLVALWDGSSPGTRHMIDIAEELGLAITVITLPPTPRG